MSLPQPGHQVHRYASDALGCTGMYLGAPGCTWVHPHPNAILKRPCHPSGWPGCPRGATPVADRGEPQWNLDTYVCTPMKISLASRQWWTPVEFFLPWCTPVEFVNSTGQWDRVLWLFWKLIWKFSFSNVPECLNYTIFAIWLFSPWLKKILKIDFSNVPEWLNSNIFPPCAWPRVFWDEYFPDLAHFYIDLAHFKW